MRERRDEKKEEREVKNIQGIYRVHVKELVFDENKGIYFVTIGGEADLKVMQVCVGT